MQKNIGKKKKKEKRIIANNKELNREKMKQMGLPLISNVEEVPKICTLVPFSTIPTSVNASAIGSVIQVSAIYKAFSKVHGYKSQANIVSGKRLYKFRKYARL